MVGAVHGEDAASGGIGPYGGPREEHLSVGRVPEAVFSLGHPARGCPGQCLAGSGAPILTARGANGQHHEQERRRGRNEAPSIDL